MAQTSVGQIPGASPAGDLPRLRRGAYQFLRSTAAHAWAHENESGRWEINLPPDLTALPGRKRFRAHAQQEARRLARAQLFDVDAEVAGQAVDLGAVMYRGLHEDAVAVAGHHRVAVTMGIEPPAASGFLRWRGGGIGYNGLGAPVLACHWGPAVGGAWRWLAWWADGEAMAGAYAAQIQAAGQRHPDAGELMQVFGALWYDHQEAMRPCADNAGQPGPGPAARGARGTPGAEPEAGTPGAVLLYTTLATWSFLTSPGDDIQLSEQPVSPEQQAADRAAGLHSSPVIVAAAAGNT